MPGVLKLMILSEIFTFAYFKFGKIYCSLNPDNSNLQNINKTINSKCRLLFDLFYKDYNFDYFLNVAIYGYLGKSLYVQNKHLFYSLFAIGAMSSYLMIKLNHKTKKYFDEEIKIEDFNLFNPSSNIIPKLFISFILIRYLNFLISDSPLNISKNFKIDKKSVIMLLWLFSIAKSSQLISNFWSETLK